MAITKQIAIKRDVRNQAPLLNEIDKRRGHKKATEFLVDFLYNAFDLDYQSLDSDNTPANKDSK